MMEYGDIGIKTEDDVLEAISAGATAFDLHAVYGQRIAGLLADALDKTLSVGAYKSEPSPSQRLAEEWEMMATVAEASAKAIWRGGSDVDGANSQQMKASIYRATAKQLRERMGVEPVGDSGGRNA